MRRRQSAVQDAVARLGGQLQAAAAGKTTITTTRKAIRDGHVRLAHTLVLWCEVLEPRDLRARWRLARVLARLD